MYHESRTTTHSHPLTENNRTHPHATHPHAGAVEPQQHRMLARNGGTCSCSSSSRRHHHTAFSSGQLAAPLHSRPLVRVRASGGDSNGSNGAAPQSFDDDADSGLGRLRFNKRESELPKELQGLEISEDGFLIDTKTGKVINEFGATRFDVAVRALRGELDPAPWVENTERNPGVLLTKLVSFPTSYTFQVVGKTTPEAPKEQFVANMVSLISSVCEAEIAPDKVEVKERLGGKYASVSIEVVVRSPETIALAYERIGQDERVKMKF